MELATIVVVGVVLVAWALCATLLLLAKGKSHDKLSEHLQQNNTSFKEMARFWSMHAYSHTDIDLEKMKLLVDGTKNDIGEVLPRATFVNRAPVSDDGQGVSTNFPNDPMG